MKIICLLLVPVLFAISACGEVLQVDRVHKPIAIDAAEPGNIIPNQLLLEFDHNTTAAQAIRKIASCAKSSRVITEQPLLLLVYLRSGDNEKIAVNKCLQIQGLVRAEWNQKRSLRSGGGK